MESSNNRFYQWRNTMHDWFMQRQPRERVVLMVGGVAVVCTLLYVAVLAPLNAAVTSRTARVTSKQADLAWMQSVAPQVATAGASTVARNSSGESMVVLVANTTTNSNISGALTGQTPEGSNSVRVRFEGVQFNAMVLWLSSMQKDYGIQVTAAEITRTAQSGQVNATLTLLRGGV